MELLKKRKLFWPFILPRTRDELVRKVGPTRKEQQHRATCCRQASYLHVNPPIAKADSLDRRRDSRGVRQSRLSAGGGGGPSVKVRQTGTLQRLGPRGFFQLEQGMMTSWRCHGETCPITCRSTCRGPCGKRVWQIVTFTIFGSFSFNISWWHEINPFLPPCKSIENIRKRWPNRIHLSFPSGECLNCIEY